MAQVRIKLNRAGMRQLLTSPGVLADVTGRAGRIAATAGPGFSVDSGVGPSRARAAVYTDGAEAIVAELYHRTLTTAIDGGR